MMQHQVNRLDIECEQRNLPEHIVVDISHLQLGDAMRVSDLPANPLYKILSAPNIVLASLSSTRFGKEPETTETSETAPQIA
jgi:large subunit ribosomal protein L25